MKKSIPILILCALALGASKKPVDKDAVLEHVRAAYEFPNRVKLTLGDAKSSDVPGFDVMELGMSFAGQSDTQKLYISENRRYYLMGSFKDLKVHPYEAKLAKLDLKDVAPRGPKKAPVTVVEFTDFQCGYCQRGYSIMRHRIMKEYPEQVRWVYKSLPLERIHPWARSAAIAAECARRQGDKKFWAMHDRIFESQRDITVANHAEKFRGFAKEAEMNLKKYDVCFDKKASEKYVNRDLKEASEIGAGSTPTFLVNGRTVRGADYEGIKEAIEDFLPEKGDKK